MSDDWRKDPPALGHNLRLLKYNAQEEVTKSEIPSPLTFEKRKDVHLSEVQVAKKIDLGALVKTAGKVTTNAALSSLVFLSTFSGSQMYLQEKLDSLDVHHLATPLGHLCITYGVSGGLGAFAAYHTFKGLRNYFSREKKND